MTTDETSERATDGEFFDRFSDMLTGGEIVRMLDRHCWQEALVVWAILNDRFGNDPRAAELLDQRAAHIAAEIEFVQRAEPTIASRGVDF
jgi:hypothetical protein